MKEHKRDIDTYTIIDIGTESVKVLMCRASDDENISDVWLGESFSNKPEEGHTMANNVRKGKVRCMTNVMAALCDAVDQAESQAKFSIADSNVFLGINGIITEVVNAEAVSEVCSRNKIISDADVTDVQHKAHERFWSKTGASVSMQTYTRYFELDDGRRLSRVIGQGSSRLKAYIQGPKCIDVNYVTSLMYMIYDACNVQARSLYMPLATSCATIEEKDANAGCLCIDIGGGCTSYSVSYEDGILFTGCLPVGCNHIENDLMKAFDIEWDKARKILRSTQPDSQKTRWSFVNVVCDSDNRKWFKYTNRGQRPRFIPLESVESVISMRLEETFRLVQEELKEKDCLRHIGGSIFLSGGGAMVPGVTDLCSAVFGKNCVVAELNHCYDGCDEVLREPRYIVPMGLLRMAIKDLSVSNAAESVRGWKAFHSSFLKVAKALLNW